MRVTTLQVLHRTLPVVMATLWLAPLWAGTIYTCVDAQGRRLSSDRPLMECMDRDQRELNPNGSLRRIVKPPPTLLEQAELEEKARREREARHRQSEESRRQRALLARYPDPAILDQEREAAIGTIDQMIEAASQRRASLAEVRTRLDREREGYRADPSKTPARLILAIEQNDEQRRAQERFIAHQAAEKERVNARFDAMQRQLQGLWAAPRPAASQAPPQ